MMTPDQIDAMRADADAGTPGPWAVHPRFRDCVIPEAHAHKSIGGATDDAADLRDFAQVIARPWADRHGRGDDKANARRIANVPMMETTIIAQAAEIERLKSGIPWRDGPPPAEWRDGRQVAVREVSDECTIYNFVSRVAGEKVWGNESGVTFADDGWWFTHDGHCVADSEITNHAAVTLPEVK